MGNGVLCFRTHFGKCEAGSLIGHEYRIVAESGATVWSGRYVAFNATFKKFHTAVATCESYDRNKTCRTVGLAPELLQQQFCIGFRIMPGTGVTGRSHSGFASEGIYHQAGIVGNAVDPVMVFNITGFYFGISGEGVGCFGYIIVATYVGKPFYIEAVAQYLSYFRQFMGIVGSNHYGWAN